MTTTVQEEPGSQLAGPLNWCERKGKDTVVTEARQTPPHQRFLTADHHISELCVGTTYKQATTLARFNSMANVQS